jgi:two-component system nitrogen regulation response regulator NtrX
MIVDDNEDIRITLQFVLEEEGFKTILAENGDDCLKKLKENPEKPDLILLDIMMPGTPVSQVIEQIENVKIVYLSAVGVSEEDKQKMLSNDKIIDFIEKPFDEEKLVEFIRKQVGE